MVTLSIRAALATGIFGDTVGPTAPTVQATTLSSASIQIGLVIASTDPAGIQRYEIERSLDGVSGWLNITTDASFPYPATGLGASTQYFFRSRAIDNLNNIGSFSAIVNATTQAASAGPPLGSLFNANYDGTELGNWDTFVGDDVEPEFFNRQIIVGGGPRGLNSMRFTGAPGSGISENYLGHRVTIANQIDGVSRFIRYFYRPAAGNNYRAADGGRIVHKSLILGDSGTGTRLILNAQGILNGGPQISCIYDGQPPLDTHEQVSPYANGALMAVQLECRWGTAQSYIKIWLNNDNFASPTLSTALNLSVTNSLNGEISMGSYCNDGIGATGVWTFDHSRFTVDTVFDPNWHSWMVG